MLSKLNYLVSGVAMSMLVACSGGKEANVELIQDMMDGPGIKAQENMLVPPEGTVPVGFTPYAYKGKPELAGQKLRNPIKLTEETLARGKEVFDIYCSVCHGPGGKGDGTVAPKFSIPPPSIVTPKIKGWTDGRIFHVITDGQGIMGNYATQISNEDDRWKVVHYLRSLQKAQ